MDLNTITTVTLLVLLFVAMLLGTPIAFVLFLLGIVGVMMLYGGFNQLGDIASLTYLKSMPFLYLSVPLFVYMAQVLQDGGVGAKLFNLASAWLRWIPGGLLVAVIGACAIFAALCGTSVGTAATIGMVSAKVLTQKGYPKKFIAGCISAGGGLGMLIPPSIPLILYAIITEESIGKLFIAGIMPGIMLSVLFITLIIIRTKLGHVKIAEPAATWSERWGSIKDGWGGLTLIPFVLGGFYIGFFTPTEAGAIGVIGSLAITIGVYRTLKWKDILPGLREALRMSVMIYSILIGALMFGYVMTVMQIPAVIASSIGSLDIPPIGIIIILNLFYLVLGCFLDVGSLMLITVPLVYPLVISLGYDGVWFGAMLIVNMNMAVETPPVGLNLFVIQGIIKNMPFDDIVRGVLPFYSCELSGLALIIAFPQIALWLPTVLGI